MKLRTIILKYEAKLHQTYVLQNQAIKKSIEIKATLETVKDDFAIRTTYTMMDRLNCEDITTHMFMISILEAFIHDLNTINSLEI